MASYRIFFEMKREPFGADVDLEHILVTPASRRSATGCITPWTLAVWRW